MLDNLALCLGSVLLAPTYRFEAFAPAVNPCDQRAASSQTYGKSSNKTYHFCTHFGIIPFMTNLTRDNLLQDIHYDPDTGVMTWVSAKAYYAQVRGKNAGTVGVNGYIHIKYKRKTLLGHQLAWFIHYRIWPDHYIDHINGDRSDNRIQNLREATAAQNMWNSRAKATNTSGYKGVHWFRKTGKWRAAITVNRKFHSLGLYSDKEDAKAAYDAAAAKFFGEFAR